ncbi:MAG: hypothetical protein CL612_01985 [Anaerolineaceae bacterium]|nr:hypothetical protein [Anaerolineaceae bacterium]
MPNSIHIVRDRRARRRRAKSGLRSMRPWFVGLLLMVVMIVFASMTAGAVVMLGVYSEIVVDLPSAESLELAFQTSSNQFFQTTKIFDRTGQYVLYEVIDPRAGDRQWLDLEQIPVRFQTATISIEDKTFYQNAGYDLFGMLRAFSANLSRPICVLRPEDCPGLIQGGSTITQQLVKNVIIAPGMYADTSYSRKLREVLIAREATTRYNKSQILEWYLNTNFYGHLAYGIDAASRVYFGKPAVQLSLSESALLASIPQSPALNPIDAPESARKRQVLVLESMVNQGYISDEDASAALDDDVFARLQPASSRFNIDAPHFVFYALNEAELLLGEDLVQRGGLRITTTLDVELQKQVECVSRTHIDRLSGLDPTTVVLTSDSSDCKAAAYLPPVASKYVGVDRQASNVAVVVQNPGTGEILSMLGSYDYWNRNIDGSYNVATSGLRQPGSTIKPFTYLTAFSQGYTPASMVLDVRTAFPLDSGVSYVPENYDRSFRGPVSFRTALSQSLNVPAVKVMTMVGVENVLRTAHKLGINSLDGDTENYGPALTLGGGEVSLMDLTYAYSVFANNGIMAGKAAHGPHIRTGFRSLDPVVILNIKDRDGSVLTYCGNDGESPCEFIGPDTRPVLSPELAYLMNHVLSDERSRIPAFGHPNSLELGRPAAAKTGTTNNYVDSWTVGYTPHLVAGVWIGNNDSTGMLEVTGSNGAAPIWHAVMTYGVRAMSLAPIGWDRPVGIKETKVCYPSGLLPTDDCQEIVREVFVMGTEPVSLDDIWQSFKINRDTGKLATVYTPPELIEDRIFQILPSGAADWVANEGIPQPPYIYDTVQGNEQVANVESAEIILPLPFDYVKGNVSIEGSATGNDFQYYRLQYGQGLNPDKWSQLGEDNYGRVNDGLLQQWDTTGLSGLYTIQLLVVRNDQQFDLSTVQVTVDNQSPAVSITAPWPGKIVDIDEESIVIQPDVGDDFSVAFVEIWVDDKKVETRTIAPFATRWKIDVVGSHSIHVRASDAAGNVTRSEDVPVFVIR